jgi:hypothetical protein
MDNGKERNTKREKKDVASTALEEKESGCTVRLFGTSSLKEGAVWHICSM